ncbi:MAG: hypothetical protein SGJ26_04835 [Nitrospirota bacterium]|nr:hypothetical protein [Nitrospirota bacterium]
MKMFLQRSKWISVGLWLEPGCQWCGWIAAIPLVQRSQKIWNDLKTIGRLWSEPQMVEPILADSVGTY